MVATMVLRARATEVVKRSHFQSKIGAVLLKCTVYNFSQFLHPKNEKEIKSPKYTTTIYNTKKVRVICFSPLQNSIMKYDNKNLKTKYMYMYSF